MNDTLSPENGQAVGSSELLAEAAQALQDWITTYAPDCCDPDEVKKTWERIAQRGGTIYYAAELSQRLREASANDQALPQGWPRKEK